MEARGNRRGIEAAKFDRIVEVNASETDVSGMIRGQIKLGNYEAKVKLNIFPEASYQILLGRDFINEHVDIINRRAGRVHEG